MLISTGIVKLWCSASALQDQKTFITNIEVWISQWKLGKMHGFVALFALQLLYALGDSCSLFVCKIIALETMCGWF